MKSQNKKEVYESIKRQENKETYEAWYEYLRESAEYKDLCGSFKNKRRNPWPDGIPPSKSQFYLGLTHGFFGDVVDKSFNDWWETKWDMISSIGVIEYSRQQADHEFDAAVRSLNISKDLKPTLDEVKEKFMELLFDHLPGSFILRVCFHPKMNTEDMKKEFSDLLRQKREAFKNWENALGRGWLPQGERIHPKAIKRYLIVKRLHEKGLKIEDIIEIFDQKDLEDVKEYLKNNKLNINHNEIEDTLNTFDQRGNKKIFGSPRREDIEHAKNILENIKFGVFPGKYYSKETKKSKKK